MLNLERIPDQIGYLVLTEDGAVQASGGDLENNEAKANIISGMVNLTENIDPKVFKKNGCKRISIVYDDFSYTICLSNKKIYVVKRRFPSNN
ncbi:ragulator complex protein LAMTOR4 homolog [Phlebotomus papatasi]|uniref:ragulator complex protein LAMTOR4 homolog n=1 Tax=Phlebotomus papatasi TaxID=29031 RepID=UPI002483E865|nr:ragulator complex protein LAMTOR4 homolog [Phlebotomus papatasi]